jgi:hypothetical protein
VKEFRRVATPDQILALLIEAQNITDNVSDFEIALFRLMRSSLAATPR